MKIKERIIKNVFTLVFIILFFNLISISVTAQLTEQPYTQVSYPAFLYGQEVDIEDFCKDGQDFIVQIPPGACQPAVVRSDLLEEQNVPVYCNMMGVKVNPLIDIPYIKGITPFGQRATEYVTNVHFYPARAALRTFPGMVPTGTPSTLNNLGYLVVVLRKQPAEAQMPENITVNLSANIFYDAKQSFGITEGDLILQELPDNEWENLAEKYSFWRGKGYVRAFEIKEDSVVVGVYDSLKQIPRKVTLTKENDESNPIYLPGMGFYCSAGVQVKLNEIDYPTKKATIIVNGEKRIFNEGSYLYEGSSCKIEKIEPSFLGGSVKLSCLEEPLVLTTREVILIVDDKETITAVIGDKIKNITEGKKKSGLYVAYVGKERKNDKEYDFIVLIKLETKDERYLSHIIKKIDKARATLHDKGAVMGQSARSSLITELEKDKIFKKKVGANLWILSTLADERIASGIAGTKIEIKDVTGLETTMHTAEIEDNYNKAISAYEEVADEFTYDKDPDNNDFYGLIALRNAIDLAKEAGKEEDQVRLLKKLITFYDDGDKDINKEKTELNKLYVLSTEAAHKTFYEERTGRGISIILTDVYEPGKEDISATLIINNEEEVYGKYEDIEEIFGWSIIDITEKYVEFEGQDEEGKDIAKKISKGSAKKLSNVLVKVSDITIKKEAHVSVIPYSKNGITRTNFSVTIGIEKRAIKLSPEKIEEHISKARDLSKNLDKIVDTLGPIIEYEKIACLATQVALAAKNLLSGKALARKFAMNGMKGTEGWSDICKEKFERDEFATIDRCYLHYRSDINNDVNTLAEKIKETNNILKDEEEANEILRSALGISDKEIKSLEEKGYLGKEDKREIILLHKIGKGWEGKEKTTSDKYYGLLNNTIKSYQAQVEEEKTRQELLEKVSDIRQAISVMPLNIEYREKSIPVGLAAYPIDSDFGRAFKKSLEAKLDQDLMDKLNTKELRIAPAPTEEAGHLYLLILKQGGGKPLKAYKFKTEKIGDERNLVDLIDEDNAYKLKVKVRDYSALYQPFAIDAQPQIKFWETGEYQGFPGIVPFEHRGYGFYVKMEKEWYNLNGNPNRILVYSVGNNGRIDDGKGDDLPFLDTLIEHIDKIKNEEEKTIVGNAVEYIIEAARRHGQKRIALGNRAYKVGARMVSLKTQCQDFMSPTDCAIIFNLCDPVMCPSSRCDLGGRYPVANVAQTGVLGSTILCMHNFIGFGGDVAVPVCLTGIYAGIQNLNTIVKSYERCLQENLATGKTVGICDEMYSLYLCDLVWREFVPFITTGIPHIVSSLLRRGGGEYVPYPLFQENWNNFINTFKQFTAQYAENAFAAFKIRSTAQIGTELCKNFFSISYPNVAELVGRFSKPESPPQFSAWFDEIPFTTVTYPATSHYKVYYHLYAGEDKGVFYNVYLSSPASVPGVYVSPYIAIASGYLPQGQYLSETKDFRSPAGYREICVEIDAKRECGFGRSSSMWALNYLSDKYAQQQAETEIKNSEQCLSGTTSLIPPVPSIEGITETISPDLMKRGIVRICSNDNPSKGVNEKRWTRVGWCDKRSELGCWLDTESVKGAIKDIGLQDVALENAEKLMNKYLIEEEGMLTQEQSKEELNELKGELDKIKPKEVRTELAESTINKLLETASQYAELKKKTPPLFYEEKAKAASGEAESYDKKTRIELKEEKFEVVTARETEEAENEEEISSKICVIKKAYWANNAQGENELEGTKEGYDAYLIVEAENCKDRYVDFTIYEDDIIFDDTIEKLPQEEFDAAGKIVAVKWKAIWIKDSKDPPEYYFKAKISPNGDTIKSKNLEVTESGLLDISIKEEKINVLFDFDSYAVSKEQENIVINEIENLELSTRDEIIIKGYASMDGEEDYNKDLSANRARTVYDIINYQFPNLKNIVSYEGKGETDEFGEVSQEDLKKFEDKLREEDRKIEEVIKNSELAAINNLLKENRRTLITIKKITEITKTNFIKTNLEKAGYSLTEKQLEICSDYYTEKIKKITAILLLQKEGLSDVEDILDVVDLAHGGWIEQESSESDRVEDIFKIDQRITKERTGFDEDISILAISPILRTANAFGVKTRKFYWWNSEKEIWSENKPIYATYSSQDFENAKTEKNFESRKHYYEIIEKYAKQYDVNFNLVRAMIQTESSWIETKENPSTKAYGLMQLRTIAIKDITEKGRPCYNFCGKIDINKYKVDDNLKGGICYFSCVHNRYYNGFFTGYLELSLAAYNKGVSETKSAAEKCGKNWEICKNKFPIETQNYIPRVKNYYLDLIGLD